MHTTFPTLFKMDSKGKIRMWKIYVGEDDIGPFYEQEHGLVDGAHIVNRTHVLEGKNVGKINETTPLEQAISEAQSLWNKKKDRSGYSESQPSSIPIRPMLATKYDPNKAKFPLYVQPKLDGVRCLIYYDGADIILESRQGKRFTALSHLVTQSMRNFFLQHPSVVLDGELYNHDLHDDFQKLISAIKRDKPSDYTDQIQYHIYDMFDKDNLDMKYEDRLYFIGCHISNKVDHVYTVDTEYALNNNDVQLFHKKYISQGYEGIILRNPIGTYDINKRSKHLQKHKEFIDYEFAIVDAYENKGKQAGQCTFICVTNDGNTFGVKPKGTDEEREEYWRAWNRGELKGKMLTVRFFSWTTGDNPVPRFPVGIAIRDYE